MTTRRKFLQRLGIGGAATVATAAATVVGVGAERRVDDDGTGLTGTRIVERPLVYATRRQQYGGQLLAPGQVFALTGRKNDSRLHFAGVVRDVPDGQGIIDCACGGQFADVYYWQLHTKATGHTRVSR